MSRRIFAGVCDRDPFREQYGRHGLDDLDALFDRGPIGRVTRDATSPQAGRQAALRRTWAYTRAWNRAMATPTHLSLVCTENLNSDVVVMKAAKDRVLCRTLHTLAR